MSVLAHPQCGLEKVKVQNRGKGDVFVGDGEAMGLVVCNFEVIVRAVSGEWKYWQF